MRRLIPLVALLLCGFHCEGTAETCSKDTDCQADEICLGAGICGFQDCENTVQCVVAATTVNSGCAVDGDCPGGDEKCVQSTTGDLACITPEAPGSLPCAQIAAGFVDQVATTSDNKTQVHFCGDGSIKCNGPPHSHCSGGKFGG
jgi:hypothetical protein